MEKMIQLAETYNTALANLNSDIDTMNTTLRSIEARLSEQAISHWTIGQHRCETEPIVNSRNSPDSSAPHPEKP